MWLLIDDLRNLNCDLTARTVQEGKVFLKMYAGSICHLCLDHDLGAEGNGYDLAVWALEQGLMPAHVQLVTSNPVGLENIARALLAHGYQRRNGIDFYLK
jgi:hypothetical protein